MGLGNGNPKSGNKGSNFSFEHRQLILLGETLQSLGLVASEATLLSVLNAIVAHQDWEVLLVRDKGAADLVVQQIREYDETTQTWTTSYQDVSGNPYVPVGPLEYLDPSAVLNLVLSELIDQGITLDQTLIAINNILNKIHLEVDDDAIAVEQLLPTNINLLYGAFEGEGTEWERIQTDGDGRLKGIYDLLVELTAINANTDQLEALSTDVKNLLTTIDADTSNLDVALSTIASQATLAAQAADIATIETNIALLNSKFNTLGRKAEAVSTSVAVDQEAYNALLAIQTAVQNIDSDLGTGGLALETTQVAGNGILTTIDAVLDASKLVLDSIDADTAAMVVDLAAIEVLITTTNSLLTTIDAVIDQIQTNTLNTVNALTSANLTLASILADTTGIKNKTDLLNFIATALEVTVTSSALPTGAATEVTLELCRLLLVSLNGKDFATETSLVKILPTIGTDGIAHGPSQKGIRALGTTAGGNDEQILVTPDGEVIVDGIAELNTALTPTTRTHNYAVSNGVGSVPVGSMCGSVLNNGSSAGTWNGNALPAGVSVEWSAVGNRDTYGSIAFDATGTEFIIEYTT